MVRKEVLSVDKAKQKDAHASDSRNALGKSVTLLRGLVASMASSSENRELLISSGGLRARYRYTYSS